MKKIAILLIALLLAVPAFGEIITYTVEDENCATWLVTTVAGVTNAICTEATVVIPTLPSCTVDAEIMAGPYEIFELTILDTDTCFGPTGCKVTIAEPVTI